MIVGSSTLSLIHLNTVAGLTPTSRAAALSDGLIVRRFKISTCSSVFGRLALVGLPIIAPYFLGVGSRISELK